VKYFYIEPEVAGDWGDETVADTRQIPWVVSRLHYSFDVWLGDEILTSHPCFIVTARLVEEIKARQLTGVFFDEVIVDVTENFEERYPGRSLPRFLWMKVIGHRGKDDFFIASNQSLVLSERALDIIRPYAAHADVTEFTP
jgi:hypothetical protein